MNLGPIYFAAPWALAALAALPLLWWLLRATPPPPQRASFPPTRLLLDLQTEEQSRERAPWWLVLLRALIAALMIIGFARPSLAPQAADVGGGGRTLIVIDNGWPSAPLWTETRAAALNAVADVERSGAPVHLLLTAPERPARDPGEALTPADARGRISRLEPRAWRPDRTDAAARLARVEGRFDQIIWISDGVADNGAAALAEALTARGPVTARLPARTARALVAGAATPQGVDVTVRRAENGLADGAIAAETMEGRALGAGEFHFAPGELTTQARVALPPEIAARAARVRIVGEGGAGGVRLLAAGAGRPFVGLIDPGGAGQPLLSELYYVERALSPYASLQRGAIGNLIDARAQVLILPDASSVAPIDRTALEAWVERGGLLVRFAGPRLADEADDLLPVRLRPGSRSIGGALAWERPQGLAPFPEDSPFSGMNAPSDVAVRQQVLAEPASLENAGVWARLEDTSPLITAAPRGDGLIVLFHISAGPSWSDLPLSGAFVEMLRRTLAFAGRTEGAGGREISGGPYAPQRLLDGFGALSPAPPDAQPIAAEAFAVATASPDTPPGLYERAGLTGAIDAASNEESLAPIGLPAGIARTSLGEAMERPLTGLFLGLATLMIAIDLLVSLFLIGRLPRIPRFWKRGAAAVLMLGVLGAPHADAQNYPNIRQAPVRANTSDPTLALRLAYVRTGDARIDRASEAGLDALSDVLGARTTVEPGPPMGVNLETDDLSPYPFLYWPAPNNPQRLSDRAIANLDRYLAIGGLLFVDTRDAGRNTGARPAAVMLQGLDAPPLEQVTGEHVLTRAFYLMRSFPGRAPSPQLWAEAGAAAESRDGVAALFVGDGDWATAWSGASVDPRQRELSLRFGVNMVMLALTGNYKADQVHVPALLNRMGRGQ